MNPIFTKNNEHNLRGYDYEEFIESFDTICQEHINTDRAKKFAFIVYDFHSETHEVLNDRGVFTELDRLSGENITIFYLDAQINGRRNSHQNKLYRNFNDILVELTGQHIRGVPFIVFFDFDDNEVTNFNCYSIRDDERFILNDLTTSINKELANNVNQGNKKRFSILSLVLKDTINETPKVLYGEFLKNLFNGIINN